MKEFWSNRLASTDPPLEMAQTRIPDIPDQTGFLERWNEFHQGYRIAKLPDGSEQRMPVIGEPFGEVSPGFLPRTLDQLRQGVENDARRPENRLRRRRLTAEEERPAEPQQSLEAALDSLIAEASDDETPRPSAEPVPAVARASQATSTSPVPEQAQEHQWPPSIHEQLADLERMNRDRLARQAQLVSQRVAQREADRQQEAQEYARRRAVRAAHLEAYREASNSSRGEARLQRARERFARVFGTPEDIQQDDYESPLSTMYNRAYDRYNQAETRRATDTSTAPPLEGLSQQERRDIEENILWGVMRESASEANPENNVWSYSPRGDSLGAAPRSGQTALLNGVNAPDDTNRSDALRGTQAASQIPFTEPHSPSTGSLEVLREQQARFQGLLAYRREQFERLLPDSQPADTQITGQLNDAVGVAAGPAQSVSPSSSSGGNGSGMSQIQASIQQITSELHRLRLASEAITSARHSMHSHFQPQPEQPPQTLDNQPGRPPPMSEEEMTIKAECQVCYQQLANIALLPCGHMVLCQWCADVVIPVKHTHLPIRPSKCPMCRKTVKQRFKIHMG
jgi:hypothetical protein